MSFYKGSRTWPLHILIISILFRLTPVVHGQERRVPVLPFLGEKVKIESDLLDYDEASGTIYSRARTRIQYKEYTLEADRVAFDTWRREVMAHGNVVLKSPEDKITGTSLRYNFEKNEGVAFGVAGQHEFFFFHAPAEEVEPSFRRLSRQEALCRDISFTTCDFPVPHYYIRAKEFMVVLDERVFARHAVLYVRGIPVFYFPVYSRSLYEHSPWSFVLGHSSRLGAYTRIGYDYWHYLREPSPYEDEKYLTRSQGHLGARLDLFSRRGLGYQLDYKYSLGYDRHKGLINLYAIEDRGREVEDEKGDWRWITRFLHRSEIAPDLYLLANIDWFRDAEIYWDILDRFAEEERGRLPERRARLALTWAKEQFMARILTELKDRLSRDRITNFAEPGDDDLDFDEDPFNLDGQEQKGLPHQRYGRVTERYPQLTFSTNEWKLWHLPFYYHLDINAINNLDPGFNLIDEDDDSFVRGADLYQTLTHILRFSRRYTLLTKLGLGLASFEREDKDYHYDFPARTIFPYKKGSLWFLDEDTFLVGTKDKRLEDIERTYLYGDAYLRFNARLTDFLHSAIKYKFRESSDDPLGEFYESIGARHIQGDLYDFRTEEHWVEADVDYFLKYPNLALLLKGWHNLQQESEIYANERLNWAFLGAQYKNPRHNFTLINGLNYEERQIRDVSQPFEFAQRSLYGNLVGNYRAPTERWWARLGTSIYKPLDEDPLGRTRGIDPINPEYSRRKEKSSFFEEDVEAYIDATLGGKIGPKYIVEARARYSALINSLSSVHLIIKRDLHDFIATILVGMRRDVFEEENEDEHRRGEMEWEVRFSLQLKTPFVEEPIGVGHIRTLVDQRKEAQISEL